MVEVDGSTFKAVSKLHKLGSSDWRRTPDLNWPAADPMKWILRRVITQYIYLWSSSLVLILLISTMAQTAEYTIVDAFASTAFSGNAAAVVVLNDALPDETMQNVARCVLFFGYAHPY